MFMFNIDSILSIVFCSFLRFLLLPSFFFSCPTSHPIIMALITRLFLTLLLTFPLVQRSAGCSIAERVVKGLNVSFPMSVTGKLVLRPVEKTMQECLTLLVLITKTNDPLPHLHSFHLLLSFQFVNGNCLMTLKISSFSRG